MFGWRTSRSDPDTYLNRYPGLENEEKRRPYDYNLQFFRGVRRSVPDRMFVKEFQEDWKDELASNGNLEYQHGFIQWLFPIREQGMNSDAYPLQLHEAKAIREDPVCMNNVMGNYRLMLRFYGMRLVNESTGEIGRNTEELSNGLPLWKQQYHNLSTHSHNFLRITRILKFLGEVGKDHYQFPFMKHVFDEIYLNGELLACESSARSFWVKVVAINP